MLVNLPTLVHSTSGSIVKIAILVSMFLVILASSAPSFAQGSAECGDIIEGEFSNSDQQIRYQISLSPGDILSVSGKTIGEQLHYSIGVYGPDGGGISNTWDNNMFVVTGNGSETNAPSTQTGVLSARGQYTILLWSNYKNGVGVYIISIGCTLRDGTVIEPGDAMPAEQPASNQPAAAPAFSGMGFPGLAPVDFASAVKLPLIAGMPMSGALTPTGGEIFGFLLDGAAGDTVDLSIARASGNLNLGVAVLSADNKIVFQASLVTSESLSTRFTLPSDGQYTIGVFRIDLLPPDAPEATAFTVQAAINP